MEPLIIGLPIDQYTTDLLWCWHSSVLELYSVHVLFCTADVLWCRRNSVLEQYMYCTLQLTCDGVGVALY
jgi:hypothetical protein